MVFGVCSSVVFMFVGDHRLQSSYNLIPIFEFLIYVNLEPSLLMKPVIKNLEKMFPQDVHNSFKKVIQVYNICYCHFNLRFFFSTEKNKLWCKI